MKIEDIKPYFKCIDRTEKQISNQGYSFNQAGQSFNEIGVMFGGIYGTDGKPPKINIMDFKP